MRRIRHRREIKAQLREGMSADGGPARLEVARLGVSDRSKSPRDDRPLVSMTLVDEDNDLVEVEVDADEFLAALGLTVWEQELDLSDDFAADKAGQA